MIRENIRDNILRCSNLPAVGWRQGTRPGGIRGIRGPRNAGQAWRKLSGPETFLETFLKALHPISIHGAQSDRWTPCY